MEYVTQYKQIHRWTARNVARHGVLSTISLLAAVTGQRSERLTRNRVQFLSLHHVFEDEKSGFSRLLSALSYGHDFISYSEAVSRILEGRIDRPYVTFSFDDGFKNCLAASDILREYGASACFFICPRIIGVTDSDTIRSFCKNRLHTLPIEFMSWENVEQLIKDGHEIGSHTLNHTRLDMCSVNELDEEICDSREELITRLGQIDHFSWPYGRFEHFSPTAMRTVFKAGYKSCASAIRGCHTTPVLGEASDLCIRRDHVVAAWPTGHTFSFLSSNSKRRDRQLNGWPSAYHRNQNGE